MYKRDSIVRDLFEIFSIRDDKIGRYRLSFDELIHNINTLEEELIKEGYKNITIELASPDYDADYQLLIQFDRLMTEHELKIYQKRKARAKQENAARRARRTRERAAKEKREYELFKKLKEKYND